jgi:hypothetical protein
MGGEGSRAPLASILVAGYLAVLIGYRTLSIVPVPLPVVGMVALGAWYVAAMRRIPHTSRAREAA